MSVEINRNNYEAYLIDYLDGNTNKETEMAIQLFLIQNPDIEETFAMLKESKFEKPEFENASVSFEHLKKFYNGKINVSNLDEYLVDELENNLNNEQKNDLNIYFEYFPEAKKQSELLKKTVLSPDFAIVYDDKKKLKKQSKAPIYYITRSAIAAAAVLLIMVLIYNNFSEPKKPILSNNERRTETKVETTVNSQSTLPKEKPVSENKLSVKFLPKTEVKIQQMPSQNVDIDFINIAEQKQELAQHTTIENEELLLMKTSDFPAANNDFSDMNSKPIIENDNLNENKKTKEFKTIGQWFASATKKIAGKYKTKNTEDDQINTSDFAALAAGAINEITGSRIRITEKSSPSNPFAFGIESEKFEFK